ncbi:hypothetical protein [Glutamicibacter nicotianae]|uniref:hypothetical protein n=1 Tax=Glutamicibacter nicotianae TaxID=37929 RepID=UPI003C2C1512
MVPAATAQLHSSSFLLLFGFFETPQYPFFKKTRAFSAFPANKFSACIVLLIFDVDEKENHPIRCRHITRSDVGDPAKLGESQLIVGIKWLKFWHSLWETSAKFYAPVCVLQV